MSIISNIIKEKTGSEYAFNTTLLTVGDCIWIRKHTFCCDLNIVGIIVKFSHNNTKIELRCRTDSFTLSVEDVVNGKYTITSALFKGMLHQDSIVLKHPDTNYYVINKSEFIIGNSYILKYENKVDCHCLCYDVTDEYVEFVYIRSNDAAETINREDNDIGHIKLTADCIARRDSVITIHKN